MNSSIPPTDSCSIASCISRSRRTTTQVSCRSPGTARSWARQLSPKRSISGGSLGSRARMGTMSSSSIAPTMYDQSKPSAFSITGATTTIPINCPTAVVSWNTEFAHRNCTRGTNAGTAALAAGRLNCPIVAVTNATA